MQASNLRSIELTQEQFMITKGMNSVDDPFFLPPGVSVSCKNINIMDYGFEVRQGYTQHSTGSTSGFGVIRKETGNILVRTSGTTYQRWNGSAWITTAKSVTSMRTIIKSFNSSDLTSAAILTGTATTSSTDRILVVSGGAMTLNAYSGRILRITSGTGAGQEKLIATNDLTQIYINGIFDITPDGTSVFDIRYLTAHVIVSNGTDTVFKDDGTTITNLTYTPKFTQIEVHNERLFGITDSNDNLYYSDFSSVYVGTNNYIPVNQDSDIMVGIKKMYDNLHIVKQNSRYRLLGYDEDTWQLVPIDTGTGCIAPLSLASGNNLQTFVGFGGIYSIASLDPVSITDLVPISKNINNKVLAHTAQELIDAVSWIYQNKIYTSIGNETFVYDIDQSQIKKFPVWTIYTYPVSVVALEVDGIMFFANTTGVYYIGGTTDAGASIVGEVITANYSQKDKDRPKRYTKTRWNFIKNTVGTAVIYSSEDGSAYSLQKTQDLMVQNEFDTFLNKRTKYNSFKIQLTGDCKFTQGTHFFNYLTKR